MLKINRGQIRTLATLSGVTQKFSIDPKDNDNPFLYLDFPESLYIFADKLIDQLNLQFTDHVKKLTGLVDDIENYKSFTNKPKIICDNKSSLLSLIVYDSNEQKYLVMNGYYHYKDEFVKYWTDDNDNLIFEDLSVFMWKALSEELV